MIRRATADDAAALAQFAARTFRETFGADNTPDDMDAYVAKVYGESQQRAEILDPNILTLIADEDGLVAFAQLKLDTFEISGDLRLVAVDGEKSWVDGGFGKLRSGSDGDLIAAIMRAVSSETNIH